MKPAANKEEVSLIFYCLEACLRPYKDLMSLKTLVGPERLNPSGISM